MEELQNRLQETLAVLSPQELRHFRIILQKVDEEPRVSQVQLELEGGSASGLARLLARHYYLPDAARVFTTVLQRLRRVDLLARWKGETAEGAGERRLGERGPEGQGTRGAEAGAGPGAWGARWAGA